MDAPLGPELSGPTVGILAEGGAPLASALAVIALGLVTFAVLARARTAARKPGTTSKPDTTSKPGTTSKLDTTSKPGTTKTPSTSG